MSMERQQYMTEQMYAREDEELARAHVEGRESAAAEYRAAHRGEPCCERCNGSGWVEVLTPESCSHTARRGCPECYTATEDTCPDCQGTGRRPCADCREFDATVWAPNGDGVCTICMDDRAAALARDEEAA